MFNLQSTNLTVEGEKSRWNDISLHWLLFGMKRDTPWNGIPTRNALTKNFVGQAASLEGSWYPTGTSMQQYP